MARDHRRLRVFNEAHLLTVAVYKHTHAFPRDEWYGLRSQVRRAAVSVSSNIVEGSARRTTRAYLSFLDISRGSAAELAYLVALTSDLGYLSPPAAASLQRQCAVLIPQLEALCSTIAAKAAEEESRLRRGEPRTQRDGNNLPETRDA